MRTQQFRLEEVVTTPRTFREDSSYQTPCKEIIFFKEDNIFRLTSYGRRLETLRRDIGGLRTSEGDSAYTVNKDKSNRLIPMADKLSVHGPWN